jgi:ketosteroid isomerase-like protein
VKRLALFLLYVMATPLVAQVEADAPVAVVEALFAAMKAGDADAMRALMHEDVRLVTTGVQDGAPSAQTVDVARWLEGVRQSQRELDERIHDTQAHVDQGLASVWTRYDLFVDGELNHCGVDAFLLVATEDGWKILSIADTRTREGCTGS